MLMLWMIEQIDKTILNSKEEMLELNSVFYLRRKKWAIAMVKQGYGLFLDFISEYTVSLNSCQEKRI